MADTRKKYAIGRGIPGFQPGQGRTNQIKQTSVKLGDVTYRMHATIERIVKSGKWDRVVDEFHISVYQGESRLNGCHWCYTSAGDKFVCKGWERAVPGGWDPIIVGRAGTLASNLKTTFGSSSIGSAVSSIKP